MGYMFFGIRIIITILLIAILSKPSQANQLDEDKNRQESNTNSQGRREALEENELEAESKDLELLINVLDIFIPPEKDKPKHTESGGTRNTQSCSNRKARIYSMMPDNNYGLTFQTKPKIYLHLDRVPVKKAFLVLHDEIDNSYQKAIISLNKKERNLAIINFPDTFAPLKINNRYMWSITLICDRFPRPSDPTIRGWVKRVEYNRTLQEELQVKNQREKLEWYAKNGFWYDMLSVINGQWTIDNGQLIIDNN